MPRRNDKTFLSLLAEARALGLHYVGNSTAEVRQVIQDESDLRAGKPPCYTQSYSPTDRKCRKCELQHDCGPLTVDPLVNLHEAPDVDELKCFGLGGTEDRRRCDGDLLIELTNSKGEVLDRACTSPDCHQTLRNQQREDAVRCFGKVRNRKGKHLIALRQELGYSQDVFTAMIGVKRATYVKYERDPARRLTKALNTAILRWARQTTIL